MSNRHSDEVQREHLLWNEYFRIQAKNVHAGAIGGLWMEQCYRDVDQVARATTSKSRKILSILEAGSGSAECSVRLAENLGRASLTLLDISPAALDRARVVSARLPTHIKVEYTLGSALDMQFPSGIFDLCWNIGVAEHYSPAALNRLIEEMWRVTASGGVLIIGIPNRKCPEVLKAALLGSRFGRCYLNWIWGFRNTTEILYSDRELSQLIQEVTRSSPDIAYAGSALFDGAFPDFVVKAAFRMLRHSRFSFLSLFVVTKDASR